MNLEQEQSLMRLEAKRQQEEPMRQEPSLVQEPELTRVKL